MKRRGFIVALAAALAVPGALAQQLPLVEVWKSDSCGCCGEWIKHLQKNGFTTRVHSVADAAPMRRALGIPDQLGSCHTAKVGGYAIEGHVPAGDIKRLLAEKPAARGLAAPGMPAGSPGMDLPNSPPYEVLLVRKDASTVRYARHVPEPARAASGAR
ncbi:MAG: DUF411 domain-containing protein [Pseudomonadota bacterium]|nr:DUF411 domain-containing protein [Pseudomonadota bacterium]